MPNRRILLKAAALSLPAISARAQSGGFPDRSLRIVVPFAPGGAVDLTGRLLAEQLQPVLKQNVVVDNRGGAGGNLGADVVAKAEKDGYSLLLGSANILCANKFLFRKSMPLDPMRDLAPVTRVTTGTVVLIVNGKSPYKTFQELMAAAKKDPGKLTMGSSGTGTVSHLTIESVKRAAGVDITHVPYRGGGPAFQDLLAGNIDLMFDVIPAAIANIREGAFRPLAVGSAERITYVPELREVPAMKELLPNANIDMQSWYAINAPAGTPADRIATLHRALTQVVRSDAFRQKMEPIGFTPIADESPEAYGAYMRAQEKVWQGLVEASGATME
ncbi:Bug family tripartite tricarboxylate transporter substrate binding protein [Belnapia rosea]|uniref:Tripartite-type tricarboxylate transporter, receptor component TctC n=1 Tax=Belnapia rosea TaxID=938405 RepID=A0A1G6TL93_9PROT|nr:tripartite tricarboxylate transporter substrate binding protein [Belnapia rosea]SDB68902.1 Tripartite-type tricarboxylate transporter, receptor component TctC [Belnapia rosea]SDD29821.1 Tripartite-type tricarboxylate transporter, receptor component TctC [Belnapia rosea]